MSIIIVMIVQIIIKSADQKVFIFRLMITMMIINHRDNDADDNDENMAELTLAQQQQQWKLKRGCPDLSKKLLPDKVP